MVADIRQAIAGRLDGILDGVSVQAYGTSGVWPPQIELVLGLGPIGRDVTFHVRVQLADAPGSPEAAKRIDEFLFDGEADRMTAALESDGGTLGGLVDRVTVRGHTGETTFAAGRRASVGTELIVDVGTKAAV